jgi:type IV secretory pathway VirB2 component (pilin)
MKKIILISLLFMFLAPSIILATGQYEKGYCSEISIEDRGRGIVPCGRDCDNPKTTDIDESAPCTFCHFFVLINNIISFVMGTLVPTVAVLMLIIGGVMFFFAGAKPDVLNQAKGIITSVVVGIIIILSAWVIVNTVLTKVGIIDTPSILEWNKVSCPVQ